MDRIKLINDTANFVKTVLGNDSSGHDWWHIHRVRALALQIAKAEGADLFVVEMAALLHDVDDWKIVGGDTIGQKSRDWLNKNGVEKSMAVKICSVIDGVSFKGAKVSTFTNDLECAVLQDADRLDAIGAIGIARTFAYGGSRGRILYDPEVSPVMHTNFEDYKKGDGPTINHFYEKLLLLKDLMQTESGRFHALQRHEYMTRFLEQFYTEWNGDHF